MLSVICGGFLSDPRGEIYARARAAVVAGRRTILIVPEQATLLAEREMADALPDSAPLLFEVTNFSRLSDRIFRVTGGVGAAYSDKVTKSLLMWRTLSELAPLLRGAHAVPPTAGEAEKALGDLSELRALSLSPEELALAAEEVKERDARLSDKLRDLSLLLAGFRARHGEKYADGEDDLAVAEEKLGKNPALLSDTEIFIEGFTSFTVPQYRLLSRLVSRTAVTVALVLPKIGDDAFEYTEVRDTKERLLALAAKCGVERKLIKIDGQKTSASDFLAGVLPLLWKKTPDIDKFSLQYDNSLFLYRGRTPKECADFIAADIRKKIRDGARYREIAVVARDGATYAGILDTALTEAGIPVFFSRKKDITETEAANLIESAYAVIVGGYRAEDVIRYAKCAFSGITRDEADEFELYVETWKIHGRRFTDGILWNMNPDGYTNRKSPDADAFLARVNATRKKLLTPLAAFAEDAGGVLTVKEHSERLFSFLTRLSVEENLARHAEKLLADGEEGAAEECARLFGILADLLDTLVDTLGDLPADARTYAGLLRLLFSSIDVGRIPAAIDEVTVGSADMLRLSGKKTVYLFGVNEGEFPGTPAAVSCFSEKERGLLSSLGYPLPPEEDLHYARELFIFSRAFAAGRCEVNLLFSEKSAAFRPLFPAEVISRIERLAGGALKVKEISSLPLSDRVETPAAALLALSERPDGAASLREALLRAGHASEVATADAPLLNASLKLSEKTAASLYRRDLALTQSRLENYLSCPLSHFCEYVLRLGRDRQAAFDAMNIGSFLHAILEKFFVSVTEESADLSALGADERSARIRRSAEEYLAELRSGGTVNPARENLLIERLIRAANVIVEGLCDELSGCRFVPRFFELEIRDGGEGTPSPVRIACEDGSEISLYGTIDRVDTYTDGEDVYVRVIDYKTGQKKFSPKDLSDGKNLQMFLYLRAVVESRDPAFRARIGVGDDGDLIPAGVLYIRAATSGGTLDSPHESAHDAVKAEQTRSGMLLDSESSLGAMNADYLPVKREKDGSFKASDLLYTEEGWEEISAVVEDGVRRIVARMKSGDIAALPMKRDGQSTVCETCRYKPVCRNVRLK